MRNMFIHACDTTTITWSINCEFYTSNNRITFLACFDGCNLRGQVNNYILVKHGYGIMVDVYKTIVLFSSLKPNNLFPIEFVCYVYDGWCRIEQSGRNNHTILFINAIYGYVPQSTIKQNCISKPNTIFVFRPMTINVVNCLRYYLFLVVSCAISIVKKCSHVRSLLWWTTQNM